MKTILSPKPNTKAYYIKRLGELAIKAKEIAENYRKQGVPDFDLGQASLDALKRAKFDEWSPEMKEYFAKEEKNTQ